MAISPVLNAEERGRVPAWTADQTVSFLRTCEPAIRRIARSKLSQFAKRSYGSDDAFSSVTARMLALAAKGRVRPRSEREAWRFAATLATNRSFRRNLMVRRMEGLSATVENGTDDLRQILLRCACDDEAMLILTRASLLLQRDGERQLFLLLMRGASFKIIAQQLGINEAAARQRWHAVVEKLRIAAAQGLLHD